MPLILGRSGTQYVAMETNLTTFKLILCGTFGRISLQRIKRFCYKLAEVSFFKFGRVYDTKSSNISKTTATNQCKRVPDLRRPGSVRIKRYYAKNGRLIPTAKRGKEIKQR